MSQQCGNLGIIETCMSVEALILGSDDGGRQQRTHAVQRDPAHFALAGHDASRLASGLPAGHRKPAELQRFGAQPADFEIGRAELHPAVAAGQIERPTRSQVAFDARAQCLGHDRGDRAVRGRDVGGRQLPAQADAVGRQLGDVAELHGIDGKSAADARTGAFGTELNARRRQRRCCNCRVLNPACAARDKRRSISMKRDAARAGRHAAAVKQMRDAGCRRQTHEAGHTEFQCAAGNGDLGRPRRSCGRKDAVGKHEDAGGAGERCDRDAGHEQQCARGVFEWGHDGYASGSTTVVAHHGPPPYCAAQNHEEVSVHARPSLS